MPGPITRSNRSRVPVETPLRGRSRQGCWTCRIRRKKCDERRDHLGLCMNCSRLGIDCIGWGERRPEWIKDPERLKIFKESIKSQISARSRAAGSPIAHTANLSVSSTQMAYPDREHLDAPASDGPFPASCQHTVDESGSQRLNANGTKPPQSELPVAGSPPHHIRPSTISHGTNSPNIRTFVSHVQALADVAALPVWCATAIHSTSSLGQWKHDSLESGCLSYRDLVQRANVIEETLAKSYADAKAAKLATENPNHPLAKGGDFLDYVNFVEEERYPTTSIGPVLTPGLPFSEFSLDRTMELGMWSMTELGSWTDFSYLHPENSLGFTFHSASDGPLTPPAQPVSPAVVETLPYLTALLFLYAVISGINPQVPEILSTCNEIIDLTRLPFGFPGNPDTKMQLLLAVALVGCLSEREEVIQPIFDDLICMVDDEIVRSRAVALIEGAFGPYVP